MGGGEQKVPIDVLSCSKQISNLSFCLEFCPKHQNIIFKSKIRKVTAGTYADLSILLTNVRELYGKFEDLSSPRAKGLRAESTRAATGRRCPHSGEGEDFLTGQPVFFFTKTALTPEQKVEKSFPRWEMNGHSEGHKRTVDRNWGFMAKIGFFGQTPRFWAKKSAHF